MCLHMFAKFYVNIEAVPYVVHKMTSQNIDLSFRDMLYIDPRPVQDILPPQTSYIVGALFISQAKGRC